MHDGFNPDWCVAPGCTIRDILNERHIDHKEFAAQLGLSDSNFEKLLVGGVLLTRELANKLNALLGVDAAFWLRLETNYRIGLVFGKTDCTTR